MPTATLVTLLSNNTLPALLSAIHQPSPATPATLPKAVCPLLVNLPMDTLLLPRVRRHHQLPMAPPLPTDTPLRALPHQLPTDILLQVQALILHHHFSMLPP